VHLLVIADPNSIIVRFLEDSRSHSKAVEIQAFAERFHSSSKPYHIICHFLFVIFDQWNFLRKERIFHLSVLMYRDLKKGAMLQSLLT